MKISERIRILANDLLAKPIIGERLNAIADELDAAPNPVPLSNDELSKLLARAIFELGDVRESKCQRIAFRGGGYPDNETDNGGLIESSLAENLHRILDKIFTAPKSKWFCGRPDKAGLHRWGGSDPAKQNKGGPVHDYEVTFSSSDFREGWWAYLGPVPTIDPPDKPKKYRTPRLPRDAGKKCKFWDCNVDNPTTATLIGYIHNSHGRCWKDERGQLWDNCRIEVTE